MNIDVLISNRISEAVAPLVSEINALREELNNLRKQTNTDMSMEVTGTKKTMKLMGITDKHVITYLLRTGVLGTALWKVPTKRGNGKVYCTPMIARQRYQYWLCKPENVRKAMEAFGIDLSEKKWKEIGL